MTNSTRREQDYTIDVEYLDSSGARIGTDVAFVHDLRPGQRP